MSIINYLNKKLKNSLDLLGYDEGEATFQHSLRPDLGDFQTNCAMLLAKKLKQPPLEVAKDIIKQLENDNSEEFEFIRFDMPGFINVKLKDEFLFSILNEMVNDEKCCLERNGNAKTVVIDFGGYNIAKELHVGHLRSTVIGESIRRIYTFIGDKVIGDVHLGDWGLNMGMAIQGIKLRYPHSKCFQNDFREEKIDDINLTSTELTECYKMANAKAKDDSAFAEEAHLTTKKLQDGYKPYRVLWQYFTGICIKDLKNLAVDILGAYFDLWDGESSVHDVIVQIIRNLLRTNQIKISDGAKIIDLSEYDNLPPVILEKSDGAVMYASSDIATVLTRIQKYNPDLILYVVDYRQTLHLKQVFAACKKIGILNEKTKLIHCPFGTVNGKDGKPYKTRSGDSIKLRFLIEEVIEKIAEKSSVKDKKTLQNIAVACIKFADLINYRESNYIFDIEQFTNYEGKTGAYLLYGLVRINSILDNQEKFDYKITEFRTDEERELMIDFLKFDVIFSIAYLKQTPNVIAEYVFNLVKKFSSFYVKCPINSENNVEYKKSKLSLLYLTKKMIEVCLYLLGIETVEKM
ncbi:MAG: arginine--tRNA ligase [Rickettsiales bacterium]|jgi:arginyl-tRNA synthetase|nr:arginine--tRNA ligase [Rickettsiales bacterium]